MKAYIQAYLNMQKVRKLSNKIDILQEIIDYFDYHNKNLTKKQFEQLDKLKEILEGLNDVKKN